MIATTAPTKRGIIQRDPAKVPVVHALDKHSGLPRCGAEAMVRFVTPTDPQIPVDTPRVELKDWLTCKPCLREMGAPAE